MMAKITVTVPDGDYCNRDLKCAYLWVSYDDDERNSRCNLKRQDVFREASDSALIKKCWACKQACEVGA